MEEVLKAYIPILKEIMRELGGVILNFSNKNGYM